MSTLPITDLPPIQDLTTRAREIFRLVVEGYLESGQPVGSKTLANLGAGSGTGASLGAGIGAGVRNLSPASIRSVLHELEGLGLLGHPHTSAGRVPTDFGLRLFVDGMMQVAEPTADERAAIERRLAQPGPVEAALAATSAVLSDLSACAGLVMVPRHEPRLAQLTLVPLSPGRALAVVVGEDGAVENRVINLAAPPRPGALEEASNYITAHLAGRTLAEASRAMQKDIASGRSARDAASADLVQRGLAVWSEDGFPATGANSSRRPVLIVRGQANLLDEAALGDIERIRWLLDDLENKQSVAELLDRAREADATRIFIGAENRLFALSGSSVIASPYRDREGKVVGVVGVIGPVRLNYARVVPMVDFTAKSLGQSLSKLIG